MKPRRNLSETVFPSFFKFRIISGVLILSLAITTIQPNVSASADYPLRKGATNVGFGISVGPGLHIFGSLESHDLAFGWVGWGKVLTDEIAAGHWYGGNLEFWAELFGGAQYDPEWRYLAGITPFIRYNFITGGLLVPFIDAGVGPTLTDIEKPDLCGNFQFNIRGGGGVHYFMTKERAWTLQAQYFHLSNAGTRSPNNGLNSLQIELGMEWFF